MKRKKLFIFALLFAVLLAYLLWPLGSDDYRIENDLSGMKEKANFLGHPALAPETGAPNIVLITMDDLGMADCSLYGEGDFETPNIDRLGMQGVVFENAYVTSPVCSPSRAALITGRYQHRFGYEFTMHERYLRNRLEYIGFRFFVDSYPWEARWADAVPKKGATEEQGLPLSELTLAEVLKKQGYRTGIIGKWHLGWSEARRPSAFGFDEQYGFFNSHSLYAPEGSEGIVDQKIANDWTDPYIWSGQREGSHAIYRNYVEIEEPGYLTDRITEESIAYIEAHKQEPCFLWISYNAPHTPLQAPDEYVRRFSHIEDPVKRLYRAMISNLDDNIGRLMAYLSEHQMDENTLVFLISDNGGAEYTHTTDNGRYEGGKNTEFEGGVKVPMIMRWTGNLPAGSRFGPIVSSLDIFPTVLRAANAEMMPDRALDGVDLLPYVQDSIPGYPHEQLYWKRGNSMVVRDNEWKLMINSYSGDTLLFNLERNRYEDPDESSMNRDIVERLTGAYSTWTATHKSPMWPSVIYFIGEKDGKEHYFEQ